MPLFGNQTKKPRLRLLVIPNKFWANNVEFLKGNAYSSSIFEFDDSGFSSGACSGIATVKKSN